MISFTDLHKSDVLQDQIIYQFTIKLLDSLFSKHDQIIIDTDCETESKQKIILNNEKFLLLNFQVPKRVFTAVKCVKQTLKYVVEFLNANYQFKQPISFTSIKKNVWQNSKCVTLSYTFINFV